MPLARPRTPSALTVQGEIPDPLGARYPTITPFQAFRTADGNIIIAAGNDGLFVKLRRARPLRLAADPDYKTNALRLKHQAKLEHAIEAILATKPTADWIDFVATGGVPFGPINNVAQALAHPQVAARNMLVSVPDGSGGTLTLVGNPSICRPSTIPSTRKAAPASSTPTAQTILSYIGG